jgi:restriction system protein
MEELVAALLRAMGYKARVTPKGPDRGRDVVASPDGLGFQHPRVFAEVKHRPKDSMGAERIRSFLGGLREGDCGLYVSTGGYTKDAHYEATARRWRSLSSTSIGSPNSSSSTTRDLTKRAALLCPW